MVIAYSDYSKIDETRIKFVGALSANYSVAHFKCIFQLFIHCVQFMFFFGSMLREFHCILWDMSAVLNDAYLLVLSLKGIMITLNIFYRLSC